MSASRLEVLIELLSVASTEYGQVFSMPADDCLVVVTELRRLKAVNDGNALREHGLACECAALRLSNAVYCKGRDEAFRDLAETEAYLKYTQRALGKVILNLLNSKCINNGLNFDEVNAVIFSRSRCESEEESDQALERLLALVDEALDANWITSQKARRAGHDASFFGIEAAIAARAAQS